MQRTISEPILDLAEITAEISTNNDYSIRVQKNRNDEIGSLYDSFNNMIEQIQIRQHEQNLSEKALRESEEKYRSIFENAPLSEMHFDKKGIIVNCNNIAIDLLGSTESKLIGFESMKLLKDNQMKKAIEDALTGKISFYEGYYHSVTGDVVTPIKSTIGPIFSDDGSVSGAISLSEDITERKKAENEIRILNEELEQKVKSRTSELEKSQTALVVMLENVNDAIKEISISNQQLKNANSELEAFSYSVSHDLRAPLRSIDGFSQALLDDYYDEFDEEGRDYLNRVRFGVQKMAILIDDMLKLSRVSTHKMTRRLVNLSTKAQDILKELLSSEPERNVEIKIQSDLETMCDGDLLGILLQNLFGNAWKFTSKCPTPKIEFGALTADQIDQSEIKGKQVFYVRDNGAGFEMKYVNKIFGAFQRLHREEDFPGTGIGLATVQRIINRHGGKVKAVGKQNEGAVFYFVLE